MKFLLFLALISSMSYGQTPEQGFVEITPEQEKKILEMEKRKEIARKKKLDEEKRRLEEVKLAAEKKLEAEKRAEEDRKISLMKKFQEEQKKMEEEKIAAEKKTLEENAKTEKAELAAKKKADAEAYERALISERERKVKENAASESSTAKFPVHHQKPAQNGGKIPMTKAEGLDEWIEAKYGKAGHPDKNKIFRSNAVVPKP